MTTNIIRLALINYTRNQCKLHDVPLRRVGSGFYWNPENCAWEQDYVELPVHENKKILLVPKYTVRYEVGVDHSQFRSKFVLEFLQGEHLRADDGLVTTLRDSKGRVTQKKVYKKAVNAYYPKDKEFLATFSIAHPEVIDAYRDSLKLGSSKIPNLSSNLVTEAALAQHLIDQLKAVPTGRNAADKYHKLMIGIVSFLLFPNLIYPQKEDRINDGRKRIDMTYTNGKDSGFFYRISLDQNVKANVVHVECKNYSDDISNPEFDQLLGRFDHNRGKLGLLFYRASDKPEAVMARARDAAKSNLGVVFPLDDSFVIEALVAAANNNRQVIDQRLDAMYRAIVS